MSKSLSRGMKQRLCLAKTLVHDPKVLLLDEPASGLDPRARIEIRELLKELKAMGKTIIISSHILPELADFCNKIGIIEQGEMIVSRRRERHHPAGARAPHAGDSGPRRHRPLPVGLRHRHAGRATRPNPAVSRFARPMRWMKRSRSWNHNPAWTT